MISSKMVLVVRFHAVFFDMPVLGGLSKEQGQ
jgi:hypothetical protein